MSARQIACFVVAMITLRRDPSVTPARPLRTGQAVGVGLSTG